jgi:hypothetical protein
MELDKEVASDSAKPAGAAGLDAKLETKPIEEVAKSGKRNSRTKKNKKKKTASAAKPTGKSRSQRNFPASSFEEALDFAISIFKYGSGQPVRRLGIFDYLKKSPESSASRMLVTNASKYGLIEGNYKAETLKLTDEGGKAANDEVPIKDQTGIRVKLAIDGIPIFAGLYDRYVGNKLPAKAALIDAAKELGAAADVAEEAVDTFIVNLRFVNLLQTLSGADRIISVDHLLENLGAAPRKTNSALEMPNIQVMKREDAEKANGVDTTNIPAATFNDACFYIAPIGSEGTETRKHSDLLLGSIVEPALEQFKLSVVRADSISSPGIISKQIIEFIVRSKLVVVDLSFHNPNVFYELAIRHMLRKPIVQIIRKSDQIPFDISHQRTIVLDTTDLYTFVPKMETYRSELSTQVRRALEDADASDNPISLMYPGLKISET